jgi:hypothetical protein
MPVFFNIGVQVVNHITSTSGIFSGENVQQGWSTTSKSNTTIFIAGQFNVPFNNANLLNDSDFSDFPASEPNVDVTTAPVILEGI